MIVQEVTLVQGAYMRVRDFCWSEISTYTASEALFLVEKYNYTALKGFVLVGKYKYTALEGFVLVGENTTTQQLTANAVFELHINYL